MPNTVRATERRRVDDAVILGRMFELTGVAVQSTIRADDGSVEVVFHEDLTDAQAAAVQELLQSHNDLELALHRQARAALTGNREYLARTSTTTAQDKAQIRAITRQVNALIRLAVGDLDGTD